MKALIRTLLSLFLMSLAAAWISGCVVHAHSGNTGNKPVKERHGKPVRKGKPVNKAEPSQGDSTDEDTPPPPPPPPTY